MGLLSCTLTSSITGDCNIKQNCVLVALVLSRAHRHHICRCVIESFGEVVRLKMVSTCDAVHGNREA